MTKDTAEIVGDAFSDVSLADGVCGWIDLLGTTQNGFSRSKIEQLVNIAVIVSSQGKFDPTGFYRGISNSLVNILLIGDAICIAQKSASKFKFVRDAVALATLFASQNLFKQGYAHRGAIASGSLEVGQNHGIRFVTGTAVLEAVRIESRTKTTGIVVSPNVLNEATGWQVPPSEKPFLFKTMFDQTYLTSDDHCPVWEEYCKSHESIHPYICASLNVF